MQNAQIELLVLSMQDGDRRAFSLLYRYFSPQLKRYAVARVGDASDDLVHNVWIRIDRDIRKLKDVRVFKSWIYRALRWEIADWVKHSAQSKTDTLESAPEPVAAIEQESSPLLPMLEALNLDEREVVELFYLHEMSIEDMSLTIGIPLGTVKSRLHRARQTLKANYEKEERDHEH